MSIKIIKNKMNKNDIASMLPSVSSVVITKWQCPVCFSRDVYIISIFNKNKYIDSYWCCKWNHCWGFDLLNEKKSNTNPYEPIFRDHYNNKCKV